MQVPITLGVVVVVETATGVTELRPMVVHPVAVPRPAVECLSVGGSALRAHAHLSTSPG